MPSLPRDKFDVPSVQRLVGLNFSEIEPLLPELLTWMQDLNWPVAQILGPVLATLGAPLSPWIATILDGHDDLWKYGMLEVVVAKSPDLCHALRPQLSALLVRLDREHDPENLISTIRNLITPP